jgi:restriction endonuclease S subunit
VRPGYKQTEVGVVPKAWKTVRLGELSEFITSGSRGWAAYYLDHGALFIRSQNVRAGRLDLEDSQFVKPPQGAEGNRTRVNRDDLLITITGNNVGNVAIVERELGEAYISQHVGLVRLSEPKNGNYLCRFLSPGSPGNNQIWASQSGQSKPGLTLRNLHDFLVALPSTEDERRAIAEALSDVDGLLGGLDRLIAKKRDLEQAAMQKLLTGQTRLPGFHGEWEVKRLAELCSMKSGEGITAKNIDDVSPFPCYGGNGLRGFTTRFTHEGNYCLIGRVGALCGNVLQVSGRFFASEHAVVVTAVNRRRALTTVRRPTLTMGRCGKLRILQEKFCFDPGQPSAPVRPESWSKFDACLQ